MNYARTWTAVLLGALAPAVYADNVTIPMRLISAEGVGAEIGTVSAEDSGQGLVLKTKLSGLPPGEHGFHVHEKPDCGAQEKDGKMTAGLAAGGHYDPGHVGAHAGPQGQGHLGDLPVLSVDRDGNANAMLQAARLKVSDLRGRALMIHEGGDNYADQPKPLGGGGGRIACGVVP
jgi:Cu-Zn family superoxide dismutase